MKKTVSTALAEHLSETNTPHRSLSHYVTQGADHVSVADIAALRLLLPRVTKKSDREVKSQRLRQRLDVLSLYVQESAADEAGPAVREIAFVLYYFLHGRDFIPDKTPEIGLLDDALLVETAFNRNQLALRAHWEEQQRPWRENL